MVDYSLLDGRDVPEQEFYHGDVGDGSVVLAPVFTGDAFRAAVHYPVVVEMWRHIHKRQGSRRIRLAYEAAFTEAERAKLSRWHTKFEQWHLVTGTPKRVMLRLATLALLQKAVHFFATI